MRSGRIIPIIFSISLAITGCDNAVFEQCPIELSEAKASYFPNDIGEEWQYHYREYSHQPEMSPYESTILGTLNWRISKRESQCDLIDLEIIETFDGETRLRFIEKEDTAFATAWEKVLSVRLDENLLVIEGYTDGSFEGLDSVQWIYPKSAPNVIGVDSIFACEIGACTEAKFDLQRDVGFVVWAYLYAHRNVYSKTLTLRQ